MAPLAKQILVKMTPLARLNSMSNVIKHKRVYPCEWIIQTHLYYRRAPSLEKGILCTWNSEKSAAFNVEDDVDPMSVLMHFNHNLPLV